MTLLPWLQPDWQRWQQMYAQGRLPHALVVAGKEGIGKALLVEQMVSALLCLQVNEQGACGHCKSCLLQQGGNHPDYKIIAPAEAGKAITVDSVRSLQTWLTSTAQQGGNKVVLLNPANDLNINAANALLKHLEEPVSNTFFVLVQRLPHTLLSTVRSRCQIFNLATPSTETALAWLVQNNTSMEDTQTFHTHATIALRMSQDSPLLAQQLLDDDSVAWRQQVLSDLTSVLRNQLSTSQVAEKWVKKPMLPILEWWLQWTQDLIKLMQTDSPENVIHQDIIKLLNALAKRADVQAVFRFYDELNEHIQNVYQRRNINKQLMLEKLLNDWYQLV